jgi:hypothetical protein
VLSGSTIGSLLSLGLFLYMVWIQAKAIQAVEALDSRKAWGVLITILLVIILLAVVSVFILALLGPSFGDI